MAKLFGSAAFISHRPARCAVLNQTSQHPAPCAISHLSPPVAVRHLSPPGAVRGPSPPGALRCPSSPGALRCPPKICLAACGVPKAGVVAASNIEACSCNRHTERQVITAQRRQACCGSEKHPGICMRAATGRGEGRFNSAVWACELACEVCARSAVLSRR
eukprot:2926441-Pleurochrysis_carterae.AAC.1